jgi:hypothetical protein
MTSFGAARSRPHQARSETGRRGTVTTPPQGRSGSVMMVPVLADGEVGYSTRRSRPCAPANCSEAASRTPVENGFPPPSVERSSKRGRGIEHLVLVGCGDSSFACEAAAVALNRHAGLEARWEHALSFARYGVRYQAGHTAIVALSFREDRPDHRGCTAGKSLRASGSCAHGHAR